MIETSTIRPYAVCIVPSAGVIEILNWYAEKGDAARAMRSAGPGAHILKGGELLEAHLRSQPHQQSTIRKAMREKTHPAMLFEAPRPKAVELERDEPEDERDEPEDIEEALRTASVIPQENPVKALKALIGEATNIPAQSTASMSPREHPPAIDPATMPKGVTFAWEDISPALATTLLAHRATNRFISSQRIIGYARDMMAGRWVPNAHGIMLASDGLLLDGEHRLRAVVEAGVTVALLVVRGVKLEHRWAVDQGRARSTGDSLKINDGMKRGSFITKIARCIDLIRTGRSVTMSPARVHELLAEFGDHWDWMLKNGPKKRPFQCTPIVTALLLSHRVSAELTEEFNDKYTTGLHLVAGDPAYALREYVLRPSGKREPDRDFALKAMRCILAHIRGEQIERLCASEETFTIFQDLGAL